MCQQITFYPLRSIEVITEEKLLFLDDHIKLEYRYLDDLLSDIIFIRNSASLNFLGLSRWDYVERESGVVYSPPDVPDWILNGLLVVLLRSDFPRFTLALIQDDRDYTFLYDSIKLKIDHYNQNLQKWKKMLGIAPSLDNSIEEQETEIKDLFEQRTRKVLNIFEQLKIRRDVSENKYLSQQPLSESRIQLFKDKLAEAWKKQCTSYDLFDHFSATIPKKNQDGLNVFGAQILLNKFRMMFVEENYQTIYGSTDLGADIGRKTDNTFIENILRIKPSANEYDLLYFTRDKLVDCFYQRIGTSS